MLSDIYLPRPLEYEEPEADSRFWFAERKDRRDDPTMVYMWARAVDRQARRYNEAVEAAEALDYQDRHGDLPVSSDAWGDAWFDTRVELHLLMECALQMYRWATVPSDEPNETAWKKRRLIYDLPSLEKSEWIKVTRDLLVHADEAFRGIEGPAVKKAKANPPRLNIAELVRLANNLLNSFEPPEPDWSSYEWPDYAEEEE